MVKLDSASRNPYHQYLEIERGAPGFSPIKERVYLDFCVMLMSGFLYLPLTTKYSTQGGKIQEKCAFTVHFRLLHEVIADICKE